VQAIVDHAVPSARHGCGFDASGIRGDTGDLEFAEHMIRFRLEPAGVARFANDL